MPNLTSAKESAAAMPSVNGRPDWKTLDRRIGSWLDSHRVGDAYRGDSAYEAEPARLPVAKTPACSPKILISNSNSAAPSLSCMRSNGEGAALKESVGVYWYYIRGVI